MIRFKHQNLQVHCAMYCEGVSSNLSITCLLCSCNAPMDFNKRGLIRGTTHSRLDAISFVNILQFECISCQFKPFVINIKFADLKGNFIVIFYFYLLSWIMDEYRFYSHVNNDFSYQWHTCGFLNSPHIQWRYEILILTLYAKCKLKSCI